MVHRNGQHGVNQMKLFLLRYMDIMTGYTGYIKVRANSLSEATQIVETNNENYEVVDFDH